MPIKRSSWTSDIPKWMLEPNIWELKEQRRNKLLARAKMSGPIGENARAELNKINQKWDFTADYLKEIRHETALHRMHERKTDISSIPTQREMLEYSASEVDPETGIHTPSPSQKRYTAKEWNFGFRNEAQEIDEDYDKLPGTEGSKHRTIKNRALEDWQVRLESELESQEFVKKEGWAKFQKEHSYQRSSFFESIAPDRFNKETLKRLGLEYRKGHWYQHAPVRESNQFGSVPLQNLSPEAQQFLGMAETKPHALAPGEFGKIMAQHEMALRYKPLSGTGKTERLVSFEDRGIYARNASDIVIGQSQSRTHFLTQEAQVAHAGEFFDQWAYLRDAKGRTVPLGKHTILGRMNETGADLAATIERRLSKGPAHGMQQLIKTYNLMASDAGKYGLDQAFLDRYRSLVEPMYTNKKRRPYIWNLDEEGFLKERLIRTGKNKNVNKKLFEKNSKVIIEMLRQRTSITRLNLKTYHEQLEYINKLQEGTTLVGPGNRRFTVGRPESAANITIGKTTWGAQNLIEEELAGRTTFPVRFVKGGEGSHAKISIMDPMGRDIGSVNKSFAERLESLYPGVESGTLPVSNIHGRIIKDKRTGQFGIDIMKMTGERQDTPYRLDDEIARAYTKSETHQNILGDIYEGRTSVAYPYEPSARGSLEKAMDIRMKSLYPRVGGLHMDDRIVEFPKSAYSAAGSAEEGAARGARAAFEGINGGERWINKRMMAIAAVTAGALMLWGATRQRSQKPLMVERDVPRSLYGSQQLTGDQEQPMYRAKNRITPENTGYNIDVNVSTEDARKGRDHNVLANSLSAIASRALGHGRVGASLHIVDDSEKMDKHSSARRVNEVLNA